MHRWFHRFAGQGRYQKWSIYRVPIELYVDDFILVTVQRGDAIHLTAPILYYSISILIRIGLGIWRLVNLRIVLLDEAVIPCNIQLAAMRA